MLKLIEYFTTKHLLSNVLFFGVLLLAVFSWKYIGKEEMPEFASNWIRVNTIFPGAPAEDVELFVTKPIEDELKGVSGIEEVSSTSSTGSSSFRIVIDDTYPDKDEVIREIKDAILRANLPTEVRDLPEIRQFKSSEKAILDVGLFLNGTKILNQESREKLQQYVLGFENQLIALKEVSSVTRNHYRKPELQVLIDPRQKSRLELSLSEVVSQIRTNNIRYPIGAMQDSQESKVSAVNEYESVKDFNDLVLRGNYEGDGIKLGELAQVKKGFERSTSIFKINGHEAVFLNIRKSVSTDILTAQAKVKSFIDMFKKSQPNSPLTVVLMDDESYAVTNRLNIITSNGLVGFGLILLVLLIFLNLKTGFWVAMGIPFSMSVTLIVAHLAGYTINNMTLAGIIIVLGIVVDDAIIIAENIARKNQEGMPILEAAMQGSHEVFKPIIASIVTTCIAFIPLIYFEGFFGKLVSYIPFIIIIMLLASLVESLFILPSHLANKTPLLDNLSSHSPNRWFNKYEYAYERFISWAIRKRGLVLSFFLLLLTLAGVIFKTQMKYEMFPREESEEVVIKIKAPKETNREQMAKLIDPLEFMLIADKKNIVAARSSIALSRRGSVVKENEASILVELYPRDQRTKSLKSILEAWESNSKDFPGLDEVKFLKGRWGHDSGSAIEIQVQENSDVNRSIITKKIKEYLTQRPYSQEVEIEDPIFKNEYVFRIKQKELVRFDVEPTKLTSSLRTFVEGAVAYSINKGEEEIDVRVTVPDEAKSNIQELLKLKVENKAGQLIEVQKLVKLEQVEKPLNIVRNDYKRATMVFSDIKEEANITPLEIAEELELKLFPKLLKDFPSAIIKFKGEVEDSRKSQGQFLNSILIVVISIYFILVLMFNSLSKPFIVLSAIPFGIAGIVFILSLHGMSVYGFFAIIGALGMIGVVVNDAIVMVDKMENNLESSIAQVASTRLRPIVVTTLTTVVGVLPTAYGWAGYDSMLAEMMLVMGWGLLLSTAVTLVIIPIFYSFTRQDYHSISKS